MVVASVKGLVWLMKRCEWYVCTLHVAWWSGHFFLDISSDFSALGQAP